MIKQLLNNFNPKNSEISNRLLGQRPITICLQKKSTSSPNLKITKIMRHFFFIARSFSLPFLELDPANCSKAKGPRVFHVLRFRYKWWNGCLEESHTWLYLRRCLLLINIIKAGCLTYYDGIGSNGLIKLVMMSLIVISEKQREITRSVLFGRYIPIFNPTLTRGLCVRCHSTDR